jgi:hypothetical protein
LPLREEIYLVEQPKPPSGSNYDNDRHIFLLDSWEEMFPTAHLQAWVSTVSYHCPLILQGETESIKFKGFRFEAYWLGIPGFQDIAKESWEKPLQATDVIRRLHVKLSRTAKALKRWEKNCIDIVQAAHSKRDNMAAGPSSREKKAFH